MAAYVCDVVIYGGDVRSGRPFRASDCSVCDVPEPAHLACSEWAVLGKSTQTHGSGGITSTIKLELLRNPPRAERRDMHRNFIGGRDLPG